MLDIGWSELVVIGVVALIVVGPKDLPIMFRRMGQFTGKAKAMAREFTSAMNAAADEAGVKDIGNDLRKMANPKQTGLDAINRAADDLKNWDDAGDRHRTARNERKPARPHVETEPPAPTETAEAEGTVAAETPAATGTDDRTS